MRERFQIPLPFWRVQFQLLGGWRRTGIVAAICIAFIALGSYGVRRLLWAEPLVSVASYILNGIAGVQILVLVLGGCNAVYRAMSRDYTGKMIESHRLTPMSNAGIVLGYLFGPNLQILVLFVVNLICGGVLTALAKYPIPDWILGNLLLLSGAVTLWAMSLPPGLRQKTPISFVPFAVGFGVFSFIIAPLPAAGVLSCVYSMGAGFQVITGKLAASTSTGVVGALIAINLLLAAFWLDVAAVKYRRPDLPALNTWRGLVLLLFWLGFGIAGIAVDVKGGGFRTSSWDLIAWHRNQWVATLAFSLLLALPAIAGAVVCRARACADSPVRGPSDRVPALTVALIAAALICLAIGLIGPALFKDERFMAATVTGKVLSLVACVLAMLTAWAVYRLFNAISKRPMTIGTLLLIALWAVAPLVDCFRADLAATHYAQSEYSLLMACSPAGVFYTAWQPGPVPSWLMSGVVIQGVITAGLVVLSRIVTRRSA